MLVTEVLQSDKTNYSNRPVSYFKIGDWIYGNHFKFHIGSYNLALKHYNQPRIVSV